MKHMSWMSRCLLISRFMYVSLCISKNVCMYVCMHACMHVCMCIYIHYIPSVHCICIYVLCIACFLVAYDSNIVFHCFIKYIYITNVLIHSYYMIYMEFKQCGRDRGPNGYLQPPHFF